MDHQDRAQEIHSHDLSGEHQDIRRREGDLEHKDIKHFGDQFQKASYGTKHDDASKPKTELLRPKARVDLETIDVTDDHGECLCDRIRCTLLSFQDDVQGGLEDLSIFVWGS